MREIKFRGKCIEVFYGMDWAYGDLITTTDVHFNVEKAFIHNRLSSIECQYPMHSIVHINEIDPKTVGQYTGLKDKNGVEIYEGDVISTDLDREYLVIKFMNGCFVCECFDNGKIYHDLLLHYTENDNVYCFGEIIGNVHDNPELLESPNET